MKNKVIRRALALAVVSLLIGCGDEDSSSNETAVRDVSGEIDPLPGPERDAKPPVVPDECVLDHADFELSAQLLSLEIVDRTSAKVGFNILEGFLKALGLQTSVARGESTMTVRLNSPSNRSRGIADVVGKGQLWDTGSSVNISGAALSADVSYFHKTPLATLVTHTANDAFAKVRSELSRLLPQWSSRVVKTLDAQEIIIPVGSVAGLRRGDKFAVNNVDRVWTEAPCVSELLIERNRSVLPTAIVEATHVEANASLLRVVTKYSDELIEEGARVTVHSLPRAGSESARSLKQSLRITTVQSEPLIVESPAPPPTVGGKIVNVVSLTPILSALLPVLAQNHKFVVVK